VYGSQSSTLRNNTVTGGASTGVTVMVSSSIALVGNTISGNSGGGVSLASADDNVINRNRLLSNQAYDLSNASSDGNDFTLNYFGGPLGCADKPRFKGVALSQLVPYYLDAAMTDPPTGTVPAECPLLCGETVAGSPGEVITLTADLIGCTGTAGLEIVSNDVVLDCNGHSITGTASSFAGILVFNRSGLTIKNCTVTGFPFGLYLSGVTSSTVSGNTVTGGQKGISLSFSSGNTLTSNQACFSTSFDIYTQGSSNSGAGNICDQPDGWSDDGTSGCTHACDSDGDGFLYKDDSCPEEPGTFRGCLPCAIDVLVTGKTATSHGQQPVAGAAVAAFDWTDATSCAAQSRPADSELSCEATSECTTGADGTCEMVLFCGHDFDVLVDSPAQGQGVPRRSLEDLSDGASVTISFRAAR